VGKETRPKKKLQRIDKNPNNKRKEGAALRDDAAVFGRGCKYGIGKGREKELQWQAGGGGQF